MSSGKALLPLLLGGGALAVAFYASKAGASGEGSGDGGGSDPLGGGGRGPGRPVTQDGAIVLRGFMTNAGGVRITFQIEENPDDPSPQGTFVGVIFEPWNANNPTIVAQDHTKAKTKEKLLGHIRSDEHGLP